MNVSAGFFFLADMAQSEVRHVSELVRLCSHYSPLLRSHCWTLHLITACQTHQASKGVRHSPSLLRPRDATARCHSVDMKGQLSLKTQSCDE